jgi:hypothetical protein
VEDTTTADRGLDLSALLDVLGYTTDEFVSIGYKNGSGLSTAVGQPANAASYVAKLPDGADVFFGVNPVQGPARTAKGRGTADDVTRLAALYVDLDVKPGGCPSLDVAHAIIDELSAMLGTRPSAITHSGGGLHPYWPVAPDEGASPPNMAALLRRWGRLVAVVAESHNARVDSVFDLSRMLRVPSTRNNKNGEPVSTRADTGGPLSVAEIDDRLNEYGIYEEPDDTRSDEQLSDPDDWEFADETCVYVGRIIAGIPKDGPPATPKRKGTGRHQWAVSQAVRLACAVRVGMHHEGRLSPGTEAAGRSLDRVAQGYRRDGSQTGDPRRVQEGHRARRDQDQTGSVAGAW